MIKTGSLVEEQRVEVTRTSYKNYNVGDSIKIHGKTKIGHVAGKVNDPKTGEQAYIVTPNNPKSKNFDPKKVKNVTVLYRGSTGADKLFKKKKDEVVTKWHPSRLKDDGIIIGYTILSKGWKLNEWANYHDKTFILKKLLLLS